MGNTVDYVVKRYDEDLQRMMIKTHINILLAGPKNAEFHGFLRRLRDKPLYIEGVDVLRRSDDPDKLDTDIVLYQSHSTHLKLFIRTFEQGKKGPMIPKWFKDETEINAVIFLTPREKHSSFDPDGFKNVFLKEFVWMFEKCAAIGKKRPIVMYMADILDNGNNIPPGNKAANALTFVRRSLRDTVEAPTRLVLASTHTGANLDEGILWLLENLTARESGRDYKYTPGCHSLLTKKEIEDRIEKLTEGLEKGKEKLQKITDERQKMRTVYEEKLTVMKMKIDDLNAQLSQIPKDQSKTKVLASIKAAELKIIEHRQSFVKKLESINESIASIEHHQTEHEHELNTLKQQLEDKSYDAEETKL